jgi:hypothetical protein
VSKIQSWGIIDLFKNPVGSRTSPAKCLVFCHFQAVVVQKLKFLNNSNEILSITGGALEAAEIL